jgi:hypothetical protein
VLYDRRNKLQVEPEAGLCELVMQKARAITLPPNRYCPVCRKVTFDDYMLYDEVWAAAGFGKKDNAHLRCAEKALCRPIRLDDFKDVPINDMLRVAYEMGKRSEEIPPCPKCGDKRPKKYYCPAGWSSPDGGEIVRWGAKNGYRCRECNWYWNTEIE